MKISQEVVDKNPALKKLLEIMVEKKYDIEKVTAENVYEFLNYESEFVYNEEVGHRRWWTDEFTVVKVNDQYFGFSDASTTGDENAREKGWEFDIDSVCFAESFEIKKTIWREKK